MDEHELSGLLAEQQRYYRHVAPTYLQHALPEFDAGRLEEELLGAIAERCRGDVLELACGPGTWTRHLAQSAETVTAVDGAPEMLAIADEAVPPGRVRFVCADIFSWRPQRRYDAVFFGFWLSHVPDERFAAFWELVDAALAPDGWVVFVDDAYRTADELVYGAGSSVIRRTLGDGSRHRVVKMAHTAQALERRLAALGWSVPVRELAPCFWGAGQRSPSQ